MKNSLENVLHDYENKGFVIKDFKEVKSGKEAVAYLVSVEDKKYLLKVYKDLNQRSFQDNQEYIAGKYFRKLSIRKAVSKRNAFAKKYLHKAWVRREFYLLQKLNELGADVPKPIEYTHESVLMEFFGDNGYLAPRLVDVDLTEKTASELFDRLLNDVKLFIIAGVVHGDLSPYNILYWHGKPVIIDFPQAVDIRDNPNKDELLKRDLDNLVNYFQKFIKIDKEKVYGDFLK